MSAIASVAPWFETAVETITLLADQVKRQLISQLIKEISRVFQILLGCFNGTLISRPFVLLSSVWHVIFSLKLNESVTLASSKTIITSLLFTAGLSVQCYHKLSDVFE